MTRSPKVAALAFLVPLVALAAWLAYHETRTPQNQQEALNRMIELQKEGRYDKAVEVVQKWMNDGRRNVVNDDFMYGQIAMVYIVKAYKKPRSREESVHRAEENLERELRLFDKQNGGDFSVDLDEIGLAYEALGDISDKDKCRLYQKAEQDLERQLPLIKGDTYTSYGTTLSLEPLRGEVGRHLHAIDEKSSKAGCQLH